MQRSRWVWLGVYVASFAVLVAGVVVLVRERNDQDGDTGSAASSAVDELPDLAPMPFPTTLSLAGPSSTTLGSRLALNATGYSPDGASTIELWDGARRISTVEPAPGRAGADLTRPALSVGPHAH